MVHSYSYFKTYNTINTSLHTGIFYRRLLSPIWGTKRKNSAAKPSELPLRSCFAAICLHFLPLLRPSFHLSLHAHIVVLNWMLRVALFIKNWNNTVVKYYSRNICWLEHPNVKQIRLEQERGHVSAEKLNERRWIHTKKELANYFSQCRNVVRLVIQGRWCWPNDLLEKINILLAPLSNILPLGPKHTVDAQQIVHYSALRSQRSTKRIVGVVVLYRPITSKAVYIILDEL